MTYLIYIILGPYQKTILIYLEFYELQGVFEWHENQAITNRLLNISDGKKNDIHFKGIFFFHFLNGSLAEIAFPLL
jgi:hypothetical protein